jgi:hypothetical protein
MITKIIQFTSDTAKAEELIGFFEASPESSNIYDIDFYITNPKLGKIAVRFRSKKAAEDIPDLLESWGYIVTVSDPTNDDLQEREIWKKYFKIKETWALKYGRLDNVKNFDRYWNLIGYHMKELGVPINLMYEIAGDALPISNIRREPMVNFGPIEEYSNNINKYINSGILIKTSDLTDEDKKVLKMIKIPKDYQFVIDFWGKYN